MISLPSDQILLARAWNLFVFVFLCCNEKKVSLASFYLAMNSMEYYSIKDKRVFFNQKRSTNFKQNRVGNNIWKDL